MQLCMCSMSRRVPSTSRNSLVAGGLIAFIGLAAAFPFIFASTGPTVSAKVVQTEEIQDITAFEVCSNILIFRLTPPSPCQARQP